MDQDVVQTGRDDRPAISGEPVDPVTGACIYPMIDGKKRFNF